MRVLVEGADMGAAIAIGKREAITCWHVIRGADPSQIVLQTLEGAVVAVDLRFDQTHDVALILTSSDLTPVRWGHPISGAEWSVESPPSESEPFISGRIAVRSRQWVNADGHRITASQLGVEQILGDYAGYSGSAVCLPAMGNIVCAILVEQQPERASYRIDTPGRSSNVLYAVPMSVAFAALGVTPAQVDPIGRTYPEDLQSARLALLKSYLQRLSEQLDFLELPGIDIESSRARYSLRHSYAALTLDADDPASDRANSNLGSPGTSSLLLGESGGGKSTFVKHEILVCAEQSLECSSIADMRVPLLVKLRRFNSLDVNDLGAPLTELPGHVAGHWVTETLETGRAVIVFDGLDEVDAQRRDLIGAWISEVARSYCPLGNTVIVTSRPPVTPGTSHDPQLDRRLLLLPLKARGIQQLVMAWHSAVLTPASHAHSSGFELLDALGRDRDLYRLAANPLVCAVMCAMFTGHGRPFPQNRPRLYESLVAMMLGSREGERGGETPYGLDSLWRVLESVAAQLLDQNLFQADFRELVAFVGHGKENIAERAVRNDRSGLLLDYFVRRAGILRELADGEIGFWDRSLQEFLVARKYHDGSEDELLLTHAEDDHWREVIVWFASLVSMSRLESLVISLLASAETSTNDGEHRQRRLRLLAARCLGSAVETSPELEALAGQALESLLPPRREEEFAELVGVGPLLAPYLTKRLNGRTSPSEAKVLVRLAATIGGGDMYSALAELNKEAKDRLADELIRCWDLGGSSEYSKLVLSGLGPDGPRHAVTLRSASQLPGIAWLPRNFDVDAVFGAADQRWNGSSSRELRSVTLIEWSWNSIFQLLSDYSGIVRLKIFSPTSEPTIANPILYGSNLKELEVHGANVDSSVLSSFSQLRQIILNCVTLRDQPSVVSESMNVSVVALRYSDSTILDLFRADSLRTLVIDPYTEADASGLARFTSLQILGLRQADELESLSGIENLRNLEIIDVSNGSSDLDIGAISKLDSLCGFISADRRLVPDPGMAPDRDYWVWPRDDMRLREELIGRPEIAMLVGGVIDDKPDCPNAWATTDDDAWDLWYQASPDVDFDELLVVRDLDELELENLISLNFPNATSLVEAGSASQLPPYMPHGDSDASQSEEDAEGEGRNADESGDVDDPGRNAAEVSIDWRRRFWRQPSSTRLAVDPELLGTFGEALRDPIALTSSDSVDEVQDLGHELPFSMYPEEQESEGAAEAAEERFGDGGKLDQDGARLRSERIEYLGQTIASKHDGETERNSSEASGAVGRAASAEFIDDLAYAIYSVGGAFDTSDLVTTLGRIKSRPVSQLTKTELDEFAAVGRQIRNREEYAHLSSHIDRDAPREVAFLWLCFWVL